MTKKQKIMAILTAASTMLATTACSDEEMRKEYETEKGKIYDDLDSKFEKQKEEIVNSILAGLQTSTVATTAQQTTATTVTTTYQTTTGTETTVYETHTFPVRETRGIVPTTEESKETEATNTTTTTKTMPNLNFIEKEETIELPLHKIIVGNTYYGKANSYTSSGEGEGMFWVAKLYSDVSGKSNEEAQNEIRKLNPGKEDYILEGQTREVPFVLYYCEGRTIAEVAEKTGISTNKIEDLNRIYDPQKVFPAGTKFLVMISKDEHSFYTNETGAIMAILDNGLIVPANTVTKINDSSYLTCVKTGKNENVVNNIRIYEDRATTTTFAYNVNLITNEGIICSENTNICLFNTMAIYEIEGLNGKEILVSIGQLPNSKNYNLLGFEDYGYGNDPKTLTKK